MGYNVVITAFARVTGTKVDQWDSRTLGTGDDDWFKYDSNNNKGQLVLISFGGATEGPWEKVDLTDVKGLAKNTVDYCKVNGIHGVDFDLEGKAVGIRADDVREKYLKIRKLITAIRQEANKRIADFPQGFFITAAPQTNGDSQRLYWAGAKAQKAFFDDMLKADACGGKPCFDAVLVQNYNAQAMTPKKAYAMTKELLVCNQDTRIVMGYDLEPTEWGRNFPLADDTADGKDAPIVAATGFAQKHEVNGAFVWQADLDAIGAASNKGLESSGNEYSWAKALAEYYGSKAVDDIRYNLVDESNKNAFCATADGAEPASDFFRKISEDDCKMKCNIPDAGKKCYGYSHSVSNNCRIFTQEISLTVTFPKAKWNGCWAATGKHN